MAVTPVPQLVCPKCGRKDFWALPKREGRVVVWRCNCGGPEVTRLLERKYA